ncbi:MAG TPA: molybdopterin biosynthesis protein [Terriglobales bacterium]|nr:molybdopterin biosynthesis protein [Terriglobales bacterium]
MSTERKVFRYLETLENAISALWKNWRVEEIPVESVLLTDSLGRTLAEDVYSTIDVPGFDRAAMDGFAIIAEDVFNVDEQRPCNLRVIGEIEAGNASPLTISSHETAEIATGAPMPEGANAVVMVEFTKRTEDQVLIFRAVSPGENVTGAGSDIMAGELLLRKFQPITPREIGLLAAVGISHVPVYRKPKVAIFSSGNELIEADVPLSFAKLYDINGPAVVAAVKESGGAPEFHGILPDDYATIKHQLGAALEDSDIVISSGSTSAGPGDLLYRAIEELGKPGILIHGLTLKPGKPAIIGLVHNKPIFGLPGYPTSALMIFHMLVAPVIRRLANATELKPIKVQASSPMKFFKARGRRELLPVQLISQPDGRLSAYPMQSGSGAVSSFSLADGFADLPENQEYVDEGELLEIELFGRELTPPSLVAIGSHCIGLDIAFAMLRSKDTQFSGRTINVGSVGGFKAVGRGETDIAGVHLQDPETGAYNLPYIARFGLEPSAILVRGYNREQGLIVQPGNPKKIMTPGDLLRHGIRFINRNRGSGTRYLIDRHISELAQELKADPQELSKKIDGFNYEAKSHSAVATAVKNNRADIGYGIRTVAAAAGLDFIKTDDEEYDFLVPRSHLDKPSVKEFIKLISSKEFAETLRSRAPGLSATSRSGSQIFPH